MSGLQLAVSTVQKVINRLLLLDPNSQKRLQPLAYKQVKVSLQELPCAIVFCFSQQLDLLLDNDNRQQADCTISLSCSSLSKLTDSGQVSQLIQQKKLLLQGDIQLAQHFSQLFVQLEIDWQALLSQYLGDVLAYQLHYAAKRLRQQVQQGVKQAVTTLVDVAREERPIAAHPVAVAHFSQQVEELAADTEALSLRLAQLETKG